MIKPHLFGKKSKLTISGHSDGDAFFEAAVLASVAVDAKYGTLLVLGAGSVLDLLLNTPPEEPLIAQTTHSFVVVNNFTDEFPS